MEHAGKKATVRTLGNRRDPSNSSNNRRHAMQKQDRDVGMNKRRYGRKNRELALSRRANNSRDATAKGTPETVRK